MTTLADHSSRNNEEDDRTTSTWGNLSRNSTFDDDDDDFSNADDEGDTASTTDDATFDDNKRTWDDFVSALVDFRNKNGHCDVPARYEPDQALARWVSNQRRREADLTDLQRIKLQHVGFSFSSKREKHNQQWNEKFERLKELYEKNPVARTSFPKARNKVDIELSVWMHHQRTIYREGRMPKDRQQKLEAIGFPWSKHPTKAFKNKPPGKPNQQKHLCKQRWHVHFKKLKKFYEKHGRDTAPTKDYDGGELKNWINRQRVKKNNNLLCPRHIQLLIDIGFEWTVEKDDAWNGYYQQLVQYHKHRRDHHRGCLMCQLQVQEPPYDASVEQLKLFNWVFFQRAQGKCGRLDPHRKEKLDAIGFVWNNKAAKEPAKILLESTANVQSTASGTIITWGRELNHQKDDRRNLDRCAASKRRVPLVGTKRVLPTNKQTTPAPPATAASASSTASSSGLPCSNDGAGISNYYTLRNNGLNDPRPTNNNKENATVNNRNNESQEYTALKSHEPLRKKVREEMHSNELWLPTQTRTRVRSPQRAVNTRDPKDVQARLELYARLCLAEDSQDFLFRPPPEEMRVPRHKPSLWSP